MHTPWLHHSAINSETSHCRGIGCHWESRRSKQTTNQQQTSDRGELLQYNLWRLILNKTNDNICKQTATWESEKHENNVEKEQCRKRTMSAGLHFPLFQNLLQSCSNQDCMVLAYTQTYRYMEQNWKIRNKSLHIYGQLMSKWAPDHLMGNS